MHGRNLVQLATRRVFVRALLVAVCIAWGFSTSASAVTFNYGNLPGATVDFIGVNETPAKNSDPFFGNPLFGTPQSIGDAITFNPSSFSVYVGGGAADGVNSVLKFNLEAKDGYGIEAFRVQEQGDFTLQPKFNGATPTWASVAAPLDLTVTEIDGKAVTPIAIPTQNVAFTNGGMFSLPANAGSGNWFGSLYVDIAAYLASQSIMGVATAVEVELDNRLAVQSQSGTTAKIQKKLFDSVGLSVVTGPGNPVPEPSTIVLTLMGLAGFTLFRRRRNRR